MKRIISLLLVVILVLSMVPFTAMAAKVTITQQPKSVTVANGEKASVTVKASGTGLTYKWYYKDAGASDFKRTTAFTGTTYSIGMTDARAGRQVYCVITDSDGNSVKSATATLSKGTTLKITTQPKSVTVPNGTKAAVTVKAQGDGLTYKWYYKNPGEAGFTYTKSFSTNIYSIEMTAARIDRQIYCVITDARGNSTQTKTVTLTTPKPLSIVSHPQSVECGYYDEVIFNVEVFGGKPPYTYQWQTMDDSDPGNWAVENYYGNGDTIEVDVIGHYLYYRTQFRCIVTDADGNTVTSDSAQIAPNKIGHFRTNNYTYADPGENVFVEHLIYGEGVTYKWYYKDAGSTEFVYTDAFSTNTYTVEMTNARHGRQVYCIATDKFGNTYQTSTYTLLRKIVCDKFPAHLMCSEGDVVTLTTGAKYGSEPLRYQWQFRYRDSDTWQDVPRSDRRYSGASSASLQITVEEDPLQSYGRSPFDCIYRCLIEDSRSHEIYSTEGRIYENDEDHTGTHELIKNELLQEPESVSGFYGDRFDLTVEVSSWETHSPYTFSWQSYSGGVWHDIQDEDGLYFQEQNSWGIAMMSFEMTEELQWLYDAPVRCVVTDRDGAMMVAGPIDVHLELRIIVQPTHTYSSNIFATNDRRYTVIVDGGKPPYTFKWGPVTETNDTGIHSVVFEDVDWITSFRCVITDAAGNEVTSRSVGQENSMTAATVRDHYGTIGSTATFVAEPLVGTYPFTYQWQFASRGSDAYTNISPTCTWATGSTTNTLTFKVEQSDFDLAYKYRCVITDADGRTCITNNAQCVEPLVITAQPASIVAELGQEASFSVLVSGGREQYSYQWQYSTDGKTFTDMLWTDATGETNASVIFPVSNTTVAYYYRCKIKDNSYKVIYSDVVRVELI